MKIEQVHNTPKQLRKNKTLSIRTTLDVVAWLKKNQISATKIFDVAIAELGYCKPKEK